MLVQSDVHQCDEQSCEAILNQAQELVLSTAPDAIALASRASDMLSSSGYACCQRFPATMIRSALVCFNPHLFLHFSPMPRAIVTS